MASDFTQQQRNTQNSTDSDHLRILSIVYFVFAGISAFGALIPIVHVVLGVLFVSGAFDDAKDPPPEFVGYMFIIIGSTVITLGLLFAACLAFTGLNLIRRKRYTFCVVVSIIACLQIPLGTALGVFTLIVLFRPSAKELFDRTSYANPPSKF